MQRVASHKELLKVVKYLDEDYFPYGKDHRDRDEDKWSPDCSCGCRFYHELAGNEGLDWGICSNPESHRVGLLTFEHQGCRKFAKLEKL